MGHHHAKDIIPRSTVQLRRGVYFGKIGGSGQPKAGTGSIDLFPGNADGRIIMERLVDGLGQGQGLLRPGRHGDPDNNEARNSLWQKCGEQCDNPQDGVDGHADTSPLGLRLHATRHTPLLAQTVKHRFVPPHG